VFARIRRRDRRALPVVLKDDGRQSRARAEIATTHNCIVGFQTSAFEIAEQVGGDEPPPAFQLNDGRQFGNASCAPTSLPAAVAHLWRLLRREVASTTAERGLVLTQPCLSRQVFYGSRRLAGGASHSQGSGASQTMQSTREPQSGATLESDGMVKLIEHSQASSQRTSHTRLIKAWTKR